MCTNYLDNLDEYLDNHKLVTGVAVAEMKEGIPQMVTDNCGAQQSNQMANWCRP